MENFEWFFPKAVTKTLLNQLLFFKYYFKILIYYFKDMCKGMYVLKPLFIRIFFTSFNNFFFFCISLATKAERISQDFPLFLTGIFSYDILFLSTFLLTFIFCFSFHPLFLYFQFYCFSSSIMYWFTYLISVSLLPVFSHRLPHPISTPLQCSHIDSPPLSLLLFSQSTKMVSGFSSTFCFWKKGFQTSKLLLSRNTRVLHHVLLLKRCLFRCAFLFTYRCNRENFCMGSMCFNDLRIFSRWRTFFFFSI